LYLFLATNKVERCFDIVAGVDRALMSVRMFQWGNMRCCEAPRTSDVLVFVERCCDFNNFSIYTFATKLYSRTISSNL